MMDLKAINPKIDDMIVLYLQTGNDVVSSIATANRLPGCIIGTYTSMAGQTPSLYLVGWLPGMPYPSKDPGVDPASSFIGRVPPYAFSQNKHKYAFAKFVASFCEAEAVAISTYGKGLWRGFEPSAEELLHVNGMVAKKEGQCRNKTCGRTNDFGVGKCWNCGLANPVPLMP